MINYPIFSVVIPLYNKEDYILQTVQSVLDQTDPDFELLVVNDGSTDSSQQRLSAITDPRMRIINRFNKGECAARNTGIWEAKGEYVVFLDADDYWRPNHLAELRKLITQYGEHADVFSTGFARLFPDGELEPCNDATSQPRCFTPKEYFQAVWKGKEVIHSSCACVRKNVFVEIGGFDSRFSMGGDLEMWARLLRCHTLAHSPEITEIYRVDTPNSSGKSMNYDKDAARIALQPHHICWEDWAVCLRRYLKYRVKRLIGYRPQVKKRLKQ